MLSLDFGLYCFSMTDSNDIPIALDAYRKLAEAYSRIVETKPHNAYLERPATMSLLPDVRGKRVLDAGCGPGVYAEELLAHGAEVVAIDCVPEMLEFARKRIGNRATIRLHNLERPLDFARDGEFDVVLSALVMDYIRDWRPLLAEFRRVLVPGGALVFSCEHPCLKVRYSESGNYFDKELLTIVWQGFGEDIPMPTIRRPLSAMTGALSDSGFVIERIIEPIPTEDYRRVDPDEFAKFSKKPTFICFRAKKASV